MSLLARAFSWTSAIPRVEPEPDPSGCDRRTAAALALTVIVGALLLWFATVGSFPLVWDEGDYLARAERIQRWAAHVQQGQIDPFDPKEIDAHWETTLRREGHPAGFLIVIACGWSFSCSWLGPLSAARFGPGLLFSVALGAVAYRIARERSGTAALVSVAAILAQPRLFAHAHFATQDGQLTAGWLLAWTLFSPALRSWPAALLWGAALGFTAALKVTGWLAWLPPLLTLLLTRDRRAFRMLACAVPSALVTFVLLNPPLWSSPREGLVDHLGLHVARGAQPGLNVSTFFLGRMYDLFHPLPWYNTLVWTGLAIPPGLLVLLLLGLGKIGWTAFADRPLTGRKLAGADLRLVLEWLLLLVVRACPGVPPHDGIRLFLPSFSFAGLLAGRGGEALVASCNRWHIARPRFAAAGSVVALGLLLGSAAGEVAWHYPQDLSYYTPLVGGLDGATQLGMEPTYWWDGLDAEALTWLQQHTRPDEKVAFAACSLDNLQWLNRWGKLLRGTTPAEPGTYRWYVLQHRPSAYWPADHWLLAHAKPVWQKHLRPPSAGWGPWRLSTPLVSIYPYSAFREAREATRHLP